MRKVDFSIRLHTFAPRNAIPSVVHVAVRRVQTEGGSYLSIWPIWIRADVLPPGDPTAIQLAASTNGNAVTKDLCSINVKLFRLTIVTLPCSIEQLYTTMHTVPATPRLPWCGDF